MRRLLYVALVLAFLALAGLVFVRVTTSPAYVARSRFARIHDGMSHEQVRGVMDGIHATHARDEYESWDCGGGYIVALNYDKRGIFLAYLVGPKDVTTLDRLLDCLGYPKPVRDWSQTFAF